MASRSEGLATLVCFSFKSINEAVDALLDICCSGADVGDTEHWHDSFAADYSMSRIQRAENRLMTFRVEVSITRSFQKPPFFRINGSQRLAFCEDHLIRGDSDNRSILLVECINLSAFVAEPGMSPCPETRQSADEWSWNVSERVRESVIQDVEYPESDERHGGE